jgi:hypothetical protein
MATLDLNVAELARIAGTSRETVMRRLLGLAIHGTTGRRVDWAIEQLGLEGNFLVARPRQGHKTLKAALEAARAAGKREKQVFYVYQPISVVSDEGETVTGLGRVDPPPNTFVAAFREFVEERFVLEEGSRVSRASVVAVYREWLAGRPGLGPRAVAGLLRGIGVKDQRFRDSEKGVVEGWSGLRRRQVTP